MKFSPLTLVMVILLTACDERTPQKNSRVDDMKSAKGPTETLVNIPETTETVVDDYETLTLSEEGVAPISAAMSAKLSHRDNLDILASFSISNHADHLNNPITLKQVNNSTTESRLRPSQEDVALKPILPVEGTHTGQALIIADATFEVGFQMPSPSLKLYLSANATTARCTISCHGTGAEKATLDGIPLRPGESIRVFNGSILRVPPGVGVHVRREPNEPATNTINANG